MNITFLSSGNARGNILFFFFTAFSCAALLAATLLFAGCAGSVVSGKNAAPEAKLVSVEDAGSGMDTVVNLERIAEIERAGAYFPGLALAESGLREKAGDYAGAALAAYKELAWAYGFGSTGKQQIETGLANALALFGETSALDTAHQAGAAAIRGCMAFAREDWVEAERLLAGLAAADEEPDSFLRWMLLVCAFEREDKASGVSQADRAAYGAIRARYKFFPEYWYRGARVNGRADGSLAAVYAEQCIDASPQGPFAEECRKILAAYLGLAPDGKETRDGIRTKAEIENIIRASVSLNNPEVLEDLFPLMALPDNPYTLYALGAMKTLASVPEFRSFFVDGALKSPGRLGERLNYVSRG